MSLLERFRLDGRVAVVTGSGQGIGRAIAWGLADAGCDVVVNARRRGDLEETAAGVVDARPAAVDRRRRHPRLLRGAGRPHGRRARPPRRVGEQRRRVRREDRPGVGRHARRGRGVRSSSST